MPRRLSAEAPVRFQGKLPLVATIGHAGGGPRRPSTRRQTWAVHGMRNRASPSPPAAGGNLCFASVCKCILARYDARLPRAGVPQAAAPNHSLWAAKRGAWRSVAVSPGYRPYQSCTHSIAFPSMSGGPHLFDYRVACRLAELRRLLHPAVRWCGKPCCAVPASVARGLSCLEPSNARAAFRNDSSFEGEPTTAFRGRFPPSRRDPLAWSNGKHPVLRPAAVPAVSIVARPGRHP